VSLLSICRQVASEIPVAAPAAIVGNPDGTAQSGPCKVFVVRFETWATKEFCSAKALSSRFAKRDIVFSIEWV